MTGIVAAPTTFISSWTRSALAGLNSLWRARTDREESSPTRVEEQSDFDASNIEAGGG
jgi:hypothetical protein